MDIAILSRGVAHNHSGVGDLRPEEPSFISAHGSEIGPLRALRTRESNRKEMVVAVRAGIALGNQNAKVVDTSCFGPCAACVCSQVPNLHVVSRRSLVDARIARHTGRLRDHTEASMAANGMSAEIRHARRLLRSYH